MNNKINTVKTGFSIKERVIKFAAWLIFGKHNQWIYWKYLERYTSGGPEYTGKNFKRKRYWLAEAFWSYMCGSYYSDLSLKYLLNSIFR